VSSIHPAGEGPGPDRQAARPPALPDTRFIPGPAGTDRRRAPAERVGGKEKTTMEDQRFASRPHPTVPRGGAGPWLALLAVLLALGGAAPARATTYVNSTNSPFVINSTNSPFTDNIEVDSGGEVDVETGGSVTVASGVAVTVNGGTLNASGSVSSGNYRAVYVSGGGTATISAGSLSGPDNCLQIEGTGSTATISDGSSVHGGDAGVLVENGGAVTISGGSVHGGGVAVAVGGGAATISGGSLTAATIGVGVSNGGTATISGGSVSGATYGLQSSGGTLTVKGCGLTLASGYLSGTLLDGTTISSMLTTGSITLANQLPTITAPADVTVNSDAGQCTASNVALGTATTSSLCGPASVYNNAPTTFPLGSTTVTWTAVDAYGQKATATQKVTVLDNQKPTITAPADVTVSTDAGQCTASNVALGTPTTSDNCGVKTVTNDAPAAFPLGTTTVTWTVTDTSGNQATATQKVSVVDNQPPTISAPLDVTVSTDAGQCIASNVALGTPTTGDNCGVKSVTNNAPTAFPLGTTSVTWTVTDASGNQATATQKVTVLDSQLPTISAPAAVTVNADAGLCTASNVALGTPTTGDNCGVKSVTNNAPSSFPLGTTTVTWTVTDTSGNQATATQKVTVLDNQKPTISAPADVTVNADTGQCTASNVALGTPTTGDNCGVQSVTNNAPSSFPLGATTVTWTVTDTSGNQATATQKVTVVDSQPPTITAPAAVTVSTDAGQCTASNVTLGTPTTGDNCGVKSFSNNAPTTFPLGATTVTWTVTDTSGNQATATQTVTVVDSTPPTTTASLAGAAGASGWYTGPVTVTLSAADVPACSTVAQTFYRIDGTGSYSVYSGPFTVSGDGQHTVSFYSTDSAGNSETPKSIAVNIDTTPPALTFGAPSPAPNAAGWNNTSVSIPFTASDATSGVASTNPSSPLVLSTEGSSVTGTVTATDVAGNTASFTSPAVKIDKTPPTTTASASGQAGANGWYTGNVSVTLTATDALSGVARTTYSVDGGAPLTYSGPITIKGDGHHTVQFASTDVAGNVEATRSLAVNIDTTKPTLTFGTPAPAPNAAGWNNTPVSIPFTASDATSGVASTNPASSPLVLSTQGKSVNGTVTVTDVAGNTASFTSPAVKIDLTPPTITSTQSPKPNANGWNNTAVTITFTASDSLSGVAGSSTQSVKLSQQGFGVVASATFYDVAGNAGTGTATANIDLTPPTITCPPNQTVPHLAGKNYATVNPGQATATDNLSGVASIVGVRSDGKQLTANYPIGTTTITWTATDKAGNSSSCTQTITVT
jgi:HYR domain-containing protein